MRRRWNRARIISAGVVVAATVVAFLLVLLGLGLLAFPSGPAQTLSITGVHWTILEGTTPSGLGWLGPSEFNYSSAAGYPHAVQVGGTVTIPWPFSNFDSVSHTITTVLVGAPFGFVSTFPHLPVVVPGGTDDAFVSITVQVPNGGGPNIQLNLTVAVD